MCHWVASVLKFAVSSNLLPTVPKTAESWRAVVKTINSMSGRMVIAPVRTKAKTLNKPGMAIKAKIQNQDSQAKIPSQDPKPSYEFCEPRIMRKAPTRAIYISSYIPALRKAPARAIYIYIYIYTYGVQQKFIFLLPFCSLFSNAYFQL